MGHWLGFFVQMSRKKIRLKFVDSFKMPYTFYGENIKDYIGRCRRMATENGIQFIFEETPFRLQASDSKACGAYAVYAILELKNCGSNSLRNFFSSFDTKNRRANDKFVQDFVVKKWPKSFCSDIFTKDSRVPFCPEKVFGAAGCLKICRCTKGCCSKVRSLEYIRPNIKFILSTLQDMGRIRAKNLRVLEQVGRRTKKNVRAALLIISKLARFFPHLFNFFFARYVGRWQV